MMAGLFGGNVPTSPASSPVTQLRLQTSTRGRIIPLVYGLTRISGNVIWYGDLVATPHTKEQSSGGKGGIKGPTTTTYTYTTAFLMGLCESAINSIPRIWRQKEIFSGTPQTNALKTVQNESYTIIYAGVAVPISVVNAAAWSSDISVTADGPEDWANRRALTNGIHYTVASGVYTFLPAFLSAYGTINVHISYTYSAGTIAAADASSQLNLATSAGDQFQIPLGWMTTKHPSDALAYRNLCYVSSSNYNLGDQPDLVNHSFEVETQSRYSATIPDANPKDVIMDLLGNPKYGAGFPSTKIGDMTQFSAYCVANNIFISPAYIDQKPMKDILQNIMLVTNSGILYSGGFLKFVPIGDVAASANGVTFSPNITPVYDLTDDDFIGDNAEDPVRITRKPNSDAYNTVRVKFFNRNNNYNEEIIEAKDQANIEQYGTRIRDVNNMPEICSAVSARSVAQLMLQRELYIRNIFEFNLGWSKALLEPMDIVTLTDSSIGMNMLPVRILTVEEDEFGGLLLTAEEYPNNILNAALYNTQPPLPYYLNFNSPPGNATTPVIFEPPIELSVSNDSLDIWVATGGGVGFGGCEVWVSLDGNTYKRGGKISGSSRYGSTTSALAGVGVPGVANQSVAVQLLDNGQMLSGTLDDATLLNTLFYLGGEFLAYQTATLTGTNSYTLTTLNRGAYSSGSLGHLTGQDFVRIDDSIARVPLTRDYIGRTISVKLLAYNLYGGAMQGLADVNPYTYLVTGRFVLLPPPNMASMVIGIALDLRRVYTFSAASAPKDVMFGGGYRIKYRLTGSNIAWASMTPLHDGLLTSSPYETANPVPGTYDFGIVEVDNIGNESNAVLFVNGAVIGNQPTNQVTSASMNLISIGGNNLTQNSSFEASTVTAGLADGWGIYSYGIGPEPTSASLVAPGRSGIGVFQRITWSVGNTQQKGIYGPICSSGWTPFGKYIISFYAKTSNLTQNTMMGLGWNIAPAVVNPLFNPNLATGWQRYVFAIVWGASVENSGNGFITITGIESGPGNVEFDDFMVQEGDTLTAYLPKSGEILPGTVTTDQIHNNAATDVLTSTLLGAVVYGSSPVGIQVLSYTAVSDCIIVATCAIIYGIQDVQSGSPGSAFGTTFEFGLNTTNNVLPSKTYKPDTIAISSNSTRNASATLELTFSMAKGTSINVFLVAVGQLDYGSGGSGNQSMQISQSVIKIEAIKK
jgi:hypothetical protein